MRLNIGEHKSSVPKAGDIVAVKFKHLPNVFHALITKHQNGNYFLQGLGGLGYYYANRAFFSPEELVEHLKISKSVTSFIRYSTDKYELALVEVTAATSE
jgi:hypothetical protein